jgi:hypothetical protein
LDRSAVGSRKYFTALALSKGVGLRFSGHCIAPLYYPLALNLYMDQY